MNDNMREVIEKFNLENSLELRKRIEWLPMEYKMVFIEYYNINDDQKKCSNKQLAEKMKCDEKQLKKLLQKTNKGFEMIEYMERVYFKESYSTEKFEQAIRYLEFIERVFKVFPAELRKTSISKKGRSIQEAMEEILSEKERKILNGIFGLGCRPKTVAEISAETNLSSKSVVNVRDAALNRLRKSPVFISSLMLKRTKAPKDLIDLGISFAEYRAIRKAGISNIKQLSKLDVFQIAAIPITDAYELHAKVHRA